VLLKTLNLAFVQWLSCNSEVLINEKNCWNVAV